MPERAFSWAVLTSEDFRALDPERTVAVLPVAATEQHGPHLPVMADTAITEGMIAVLRRRLPDDLQVLRDMTAFSLNRLHAHPIR